MMEMFLHVSFSPSREPLPCDAQLNAGSVSDYQPGDKAD